jgi:hypothetical protein
MKRLLVWSSVLALVAAPAASAFPEQPGDNVKQGCESLLTNPDRALHTVLTPGGIVIDVQHMSNQAASILLAQLFDACFGAP